MRIQYFEDSDTLYVVFKGTAPGSGPPHPARVPMKCIGIAAHPLPQGGEGDTGKSACGMDDFEFRVSNFEFRISIFEEK